MYGYDDQLDADCYHQTVLDTTSRGTLDTVAEIDLSRDEDSVTTIANLGSRDGLVTLAGINSSTADQKAGKNEHLRTFQIKYPKRKRPAETSEKDDDETTEGSITFAGKAALFQPATGPKPETYQRLLKLSPAFKRESGNRRIGVIATGLAKQSEIVVFDATRTPPRQSEIISRIPMRGNAEAADLDVAEVETNTFSVAWCTDYDVFEQTIVYDFSSGKAEFAPTHPRMVHSIPLREDASKPPRSKYRSVRFLTDEDLLLVTNLPNKTGAELQILHLYPSGPAAVLFHKILPSHVKQAVGLDVCALDPDSNGSRQIVIAVAGQDISINVYTIDYNGLTRTYSPFKKFTTLRDVHPLQMTSLRFSPFHSPTRPPAPNPEDVKGGERKPGVPVPPHPGPQYIKLCSASMGNTVVVETMALSPLEPSKRESRYVLSHPSDGKYLTTAYIILGSLIALVTAILLQSFLYPTSSTSLGSLMPLPSTLKSILTKPVSAADGFGRGGKEKIELMAAKVSDNVPSAAEITNIPVSAGQRLADLLHLHLPSSLSGSDSDADAAKKALIIREGADTTSSALSVDVVSDWEDYLKRDTAARRWHQLAEHEKEAWRKRLTEAGHWGVDEGEKVLKGVLFGSWSGFVGQVAGEAIREL